MDISKLLNQLRRELAHMDAAILSLEQLQAKGARLRHPQRPPAESPAAETTTEARRRRLARRRNPIE